MAIRTIPAHASMRSVPALAKIDGINCKIGCVVAPSEWTEDGPSMVTELSCGRRDSAADDTPSFGRAHAEFFVPIDDRAGLQQDRGHFGRSEHDEFVIAVDT